MFRLMLWMPTRRSGGEAIVLLAFIFAGRQTLHGYLEEEV